MNHWSAIASSGSLVPTVAETPHSQIPVSHRLPLLANPHRPKSLVACGRLSSVVVSAWPFLQSVPNTLILLIPIAAVATVTSSFVESGPRLAGHNGLTLLASLLSRPCCRHTILQAPTWATLSCSCCALSVLPSIIVQYATRNLRLSQRLVVAALAVAGIGAFPVARVGTCSRRIPSVFRRLVARRSPRIQFQFVAPRHCIRQQ